MGFLEILEILQIFVYHFTITKIYTSIIERIAKLETKIDMHLNSHEADTTLNSRGIK